MSLGGFIRRVGYRIKDCVKNPKGTRIHEQWREMERVLSDYSTGWPCVEKALEECLDYAVSHTEFYRTCKRGEKVSLSDFPVLNKMDFVKNAQAMRSSEFPDAACHLTSTSGSTGTPFVIAQDPGKRNRVLAELQLYGEYAGYRSHERMLFIRAFDNRTAWSKFWSNVRQIGALSFSRENLKRILQSELRGTCAVSAYASTLDQFSAYMLEEGIRGGDSVRVVFSGAEHLQSTVRERLHKVWPKASVVSRYSNMENGILGQEFDSVPDRYQLCWASYYFEVLKLDSDEPAGEGELGRIVVTDLYNRAQPMIRYDTGDVGRLEAGKGGWPVLADLAGRRMDLIYDTRGTPLSPHAATYGIMCEGETWVRQWQFIQEGEKNYRVIFSSDRPGDSQAALVKKIAVFKRILGEDATIEIERVDDIPVLASGKRKMIVQKWKR